MTISTSDTLPEASPASLRDEAPAATTASSQTQKKAAGAIPSFVKAHIVPIVKRLGAYLVPRLLGLQLVDSSANVAVQHLGVVKATLEQFSFNVSWEGGSKALVATAVTKNLRVAVDCVDVEEGGEPLRADDDALGGLQHVRSFDGAEGRRRLLKQHSIGSFVMPNSRQNVITLEPSSLVVGVKANLLLLEGQVTSIDVQVEEFGW